MIYFDKFIKQVTNYPKNHCQLSFCGKDFCKDSNPIRVHPSRSPCPRHGHRRHRAVVAVLVVVMVVMVSVSVAWSQQALPSGSSSILIFKWVLCHHRHRSRQSLLLLGCKFCLLPGFQDGISESIKLHHKSSPHRKSIGVCWWFGSQLDSDSKSS